jgi:SHS family lactate transporter-like MFS transporter
MATPTSSGVLPAQTRFRDLTADQWHAFFGAFLGWVLDGFDFSILSYLLIDIEHSFTVDKALAGALGTVTLLFRLAGGLAAGTIADRYGRRLPLALSILWFSLFSLLSGFSTSYALLFGCRALFGIGMGGVWASGIPLALEHWPDHLRGTASGLLQGGFNWGYILAALAFQALYPASGEPSSEAWRWFFWLGSLPALLVFWILLRVKESPVWLARRTRLGESREREGLSVVRIFRRDLLKTTVQTSVLMSIFMVSYYSITFWYPTFVREAHLAPVQYLIALHLGGILGTASWGRVAETGLGRRGSATLAALIGILAIPLYVGGRSPLLWLFGALLMGMSGIGVWGIVPSYLTERFPTTARGAGPGFAYHLGAAVGSMTPALIGALQDRGITLAGAMMACMAVSGLLVVGIIWLGPETRGRKFVPAE